MVVSKNKLEEPLLIKLASDKSDLVRMTVARHKKATLAVCDGLTRKGLLVYRANDRKHDVYSVYGHI